MESKRRSHAKGIVGKWKNGDTFIFTDIETFLVPRWWPHWLTGLAARNPRLMVRLFGWWVAK